MTDDQQKRPNPWVVIGGLIVGTVVLLATSIFSASEEQGLSESQLERRAELFAKFWPQAPAYYGGTQSDWYHERTEKVVGRSVSDWRELFSLADHHRINEDGTSRYTFMFGEDRNHAHVFRVEDGIITDAQNEAWSH